DPLSFVPERWLAEAAQRIPRFAYFPFGGGPRICIGNHFAMLEATLALASIVRQVRLSLPDTFELAFVPTITLRPRGPVQMQVESRTLESGTHKTARGNHIASPSDSNGIRQSN
ncbi:MAG TPA: cytochrome P450, partial [Polyangiaceae bacterium]|nr:cytochrome P450 [Polyangiaceae bacterium]